MEVYLIRHGIAIPGLNGIEDAKRELTEVGKEKTKKVAQQLEQLGLSFDLILTSPLVRARQTAEILRSKKLSSKLEEATYLAPEGDIHTWLQWIQQQPKSIQSIALVGHQPDLANWASILIWGEIKAGLILKKAGIIGLTLPETGSPIGCSQMFWLTAPRLLL